MSQAPSGIPTAMPTGQPMISGGGLLVNYRTESPSSAVITQAPTGYPTGYPTSEPSKKPSMAAKTMAPTHGSYAPTGYPTGYPTTEPSRMPTMGVKTMGPTHGSHAPTGYPTGYPTAEPTKEPTMGAKKMGTMAPTTNVHAPTGYPTGYPTAEPTKEPIRHTQMPSSMMKINPVPSGYPTAMPTGQPMMSGGGILVHNHNHTGFPTPSPSMVITITMTVNVTLFITAFTDCATFNAGGSAALRKTIIDALISLGLISANTTAIACGAPLHTSSAFKQLTASVPVISASFDVTYGSSSLTPGEIKAALATPAFTAAFRHNLEEYAMATNQPNLLAISQTADVSLTAPVSSTTTAGSSASSASGSSSNTTAIIASVVVAGSVLLFAMLAFLYYRSRNQKNAEKAQAIDAQSSSVEHNAGFVFEMDRN